MRNLKINILYDFKDGPWGGGNQFLKALRKGLIQKGAYDDNVESADVIIFNANPDSIKKYLLTLFKYAGSKIIIMRFDGPIYEARKDNLFYDNILFKISEKFSDGNVFQSEYSRARCKHYGLKTKKFEEVIINAPDSEVFNNKVRVNKKPDEKIKLITTSWSANPRKGFDVLEFLDNSLDFAKYDFTFVGNSPIQFKNIQHIPPVESKKLSLLYQEHDIFISTSLFEACSNSVIEAVHCGCIPLLRNNSSHPELVKSDPRFLFEGKDDILDKIETLTTLQNFNSEITLPVIEDIAQKYLSLGEMIYDASGTEDKRKLIRFYTIALILFLINIRKILRLS